jgi:hypothetical protein
MGPTEAKWQFGRAVKTRRGHAIVRFSAVLNTLHFSVRRWHSLITEGRDRHPRHTTCTPLAHPISVVPVVHHRAAPRGRPNFFASTPAASPYPASTPPLTFFILIFCGWPRGQGRLRRWRGASRRTARRWPLLGEWPSFKLRWLGSWNLCRDLCRNPPIPAHVEGVCLELLGYR